MVSETANSHPKSSGDGKIVIFCLQFCFVQKHFMRAQMERFKRSNVHIFIGFFGIEDLISTSP